MGRSDKQVPDGGEARRQLLADLPVVERRLELAGTPTAVLEGGNGPPLVLLHGPGEFGAKWLRVLPDLVTTHRVVAPDLPGHGTSGVPDGPLDADAVLAWLGELIEATCPSPPVLVGQSLGGAMAARFAVRHSDRLRQLVLVDSGGLAPFRPAPRFALTLVGFLAHPTERSYERFMHHCSHDLDGLRSGLGDRWEPYAAYNIERARSPSGKAVRKLLREVGTPPIPPDQLAAITVPTTLIWGRQDKALKLRIAEAASARYGWPLHVIEDCADDAPRDQPEAFLRVLQPLLATP